MFSGRFNLEMRLTDREILKIIYRSEEPVSQAAMGEKLGCSGRTVMRSIKRLSDSGILEIQSSERGFGGPYKYQINLEKLPDDIRSDLE